MTAFQEVTTSTELLEANSVKLQSPFTFLKRCVDIHHSLRNLHCHLSHGLQDENLSRKSASCTFLWEPNVSTSYLHHASLWRQHHNHWTQTLRKQISFRSQYATSLSHFFSPHTIEPQNGLGIFSYISTGQFSQCLKLPGYCSKRALHMLLFLFSSSFVPPYFISFLDFTYMGLNSKAIKQSIFN